MELVEGPSLQGYLTSGGRPQPAQSADIVRQAAAALDYAHQKGVVHRDIKPANLMLQHQTQVKIADFGIARITFAPKHTVTGTVMGTPEYMSPEQIEAHEVSGKSDQFSLAVIAYQLLTGAMPFQGGSSASIMHRIVAGPRPSARAVNPALQGAVDEVLQRGMAHLPEQRYASCTEFAGRLETALRLRDKTQVTLMSGRRRAVVIAIAALVLVTLSAGSLYHYLGWREKQIVATPPPPVKPPTVPHDNTVGDPAQTTPEPVASTKPVPEKPLTSPSTAPPGINPVSKQVARGSQNPPPVAPSPLPGKPPPSPGTQLSGSNPVNPGVALGSQKPLPPVGPGRQTGVGVPPALAADSVAELRTAASAGDAAAMERLGQMYERSNDVPQGTAQAFYWYKKAADAGRAFSIYRLGVLYETGTGTVRNVNEAVRLYQRAAAAGSAEASRRLAELPTAATRPEPRPVEPSVSTANPGPITVRVPANAPWTDTGINLHGGDIVTVTGSGLIAVTADGLVPPKAPGGFAPNCAATVAFYHRSLGSLPAPNLPCWSLIGRVGNNVVAFEIGVKQVFRVPSAGRLYLGVNDDTFGDNSGYWTAVVSLQSVR